MFPYRRFGFKAAVASDQSGASVVIYVTRLTGARRKRGAK
jgi:hypothetical protein